MVLRILVGLIGIPVGFLILLYRDKVKDFVGDVSFAENYLGSGGTWTFLALMAILTSVLSFLFMIGTLQTMFLSAFGRFFF